MPLSPKRGYLVRVDMMKNITHYIPKSGRKHHYDKCWCHPITDEVGGAIHHHYMKINKARC